MANASPPPVRPALHFPAPINSSNRRNRRLCNLKLYGQIAGVPLRTTIKLDRRAPLKVRKASQTQINLLWLPAPIKAVLIVKYYFLSTISARQLPREKIGVIRQDPIGK